MAATKITTAGTATAPTGFATQRHLHYDSQGDRYWFFFADSTNLNQVKSYYSNTGGDITTWTAGAAFTLSGNLSTNDGRCFDVTLKVIGGVTVVMLVANVLSGSATFPTSCRATISGTTLTWGSELSIDAGHSQPDANGTPYGISVCFDSNNKATVFCEGAVGGAGNCSKYIAINADLGTSWTAAWNLGTLTIQPVGYLHNVGVVPLASGATLAVSDNGPSTGTTDLTSVDSYISSTTANVFTTVSATDVNNFGLGQVSASDNHCVLRTGTNSYSHKRNNGTNWTTLSGATLPTHTSLSGGGIPLVSDGTNVWAAIIDSASGNNVYTLEWTAGTWGTWTALESTSQTRSNLGACPTIANNQAVFYWSQVNGSNKDIYVEALSFGGGSVVSVAITLAATLGLTLTGLATALGSDTFGITAGQSQSGGATAGGSLACGLTLGQTLAAAAAAGASITFAVTDGLSLAGAATASASASFGVTETLSLAGLAAAAGSVSFADTLAFLSAGGQTLQASLSLGITQALSLSASATIQVSVTFAETLADAYAATAATQGAVTVALSVALSAIAQAVAEAGLTFDIVEIVGFDGSGGSGPSTTSYVLLLLSNGSYVALKIG